MHIHLLEIMFVLFFKVQPGDGLPETLCVQCVLQVSRAFNFKQICQRSDTSLRQVLLDTLAESCVATIVEEENVDVKDVTQICQPMMVDADPGQHQVQQVDYQGVDVAAGKCMLIVQHLPLLDETDTQMLGMSASDEIRDDEHEGNSDLTGSFPDVHQHMDMSLDDRKDIIDIVSSLPLDDGDSRINNEFGELDNLLDDYPVYEHCPVRFRHLFQ